MKAIKRITRLIKNLVKFLSNLSKYDNFYWAANSCRNSNSLIDDTAVIYGNYALKNVTIGYSTYISHNANISNTTIGKFCSIGPNVIMGWGIHPTDGISTHPAFYSSIKKSKITLCDTTSIDEYKPIKIGNDVFIGANVTVLDGITIGDGAVIGAGAVVSKDIPPYAIAVGCPIKVIKYRFDPSTIANLLRSHWWDGEKSKLIKVKQHFFHTKAFIDEIEEEKSFSVSSN